MPGAQLPIMEPMSRVSSPTFVGRESELRQIGEVLGDAFRGRSGLILLAGEAGVGKTRLVEEVVRQARDLGGIALVGACVVGGSALPFAPLAEALRMLAIDRSPNEAGKPPGPTDIELTGLLPDAGHPGTARERDHVGIDSVQARLFEGILGRFRSLSQDRGLLFVVEDVHWADPSTLDLLAFLARNSTDAGILVLATFRTDELHRRHPLLPYLAELERGRRMQRIDLVPFDRNELSAQIGGIRDGPPDADLLEAVFSRSGGNPFFVEELLAVQTPGRVLPTVLRDVLLARVAALTEPTQELLRDASASAPRISTRLLARVAKRDEANLVPLLRDAVERHILVPVEPSAEEAFVFRHSLLQEAIYAELLPGERVRLHARFADAIADVQGGLNDGNAAELAHHWSASHELARALEASVRAGAAALGMHALADSNAQFERALELWDQVPDAPQRAGLDRIGLLELAARTAAETNPLRAVSLMQEAVSSAGDAAEPTRLGLLKERLGRYLWNAGRGFPALESCREAVRLVPETPSLARARVTASLAQIMVNEMLIGEAQPFCEEAVSVARRVGALEIESHALTSLGLVVLYGGDFEGGLRIMRDGLEIALRAESVEDAARAYANLVDVMNHSGRLAEAGDAANEAFAFALAHGLAHTYGVISLCEGASALQRMGRWRDAAALIERARRYEVPGTSELFVQERLALLDVWQGRHRDAARRIERLRPLIEHTVEAQWVGPLAEAAAELHLWMGQPGDARAELDAAMQRLPIEEPRMVTRTGPLLVLALRAEADAAALARARRAEGEIEASRAIADRHLGVLRSVRESVLRERPNFASQAQAFWAIGEAESGRLDDTSDPEQWAAAGDAFSAIPMEYQRGYALWRQAEALLLRKSVNRSAAAGPLREAHAIAVDLDAAPLREEIERLAARARLDLAVEPPKPQVADALGPFGLTTREREVLGLLASGRTNRQIADELFITNRTAGHHVSTILAKLGVQGRTEAAATAHRLGLTTQTIPGAVVDE